MPREAQTTAKPRSVDAPPLILRAPSSHLYPGARLRLTDVATADAVEQRAEVGSDAVLLFADGVEAMAQLRRDCDGDLVLRVAAYVTARGTFISARNWRIRSVEQGRDGLELRLGLRLPSPLPAAL